MPNVNEQGGRKKIVIVETPDLVRERARDIADAKMTESKEGMKGIKGFFKKIWTHNLAYEYYRQKEVKKTTKEVELHRNIFVDETKNRDAHNAAMAAVVQRFTQEGEELLHKEAGETKDTLEKVFGYAEAALIQDKIKNLIKEYTEQNKDDLWFENERVKILESFTNDRREGNVALKYSDNMLEIAKEVKSSVDHKKALDELDFYFGRAKAGVRTEASYNKVDKIVDKVSKIPLVGKLVNETTVATAASIAYCGASFISQRFARSKALAWASFGGTAAIGAGIAGAREGKRLEEERRQHFRERAQGKEFDDKEAARRKEMEQYRYESLSARVATEELQKFEKEELSQEEIQSLIGTLAEIEARNKLSDQKKIDLFHFSDIKTVEKERLDLDLARWKMRAKLEKLALEGKFSTTSGKSFENFLNDTVTLKTGELEKGATKDGKKIEGINEKNARFSAMKRKGVSKAALKGLITGLVIGGTAHEAFSWLRDDHTGILEFFLNKGKPNVPLMDSYNPDTVKEVTTVLNNCFEGKMDLSNIHETMVGGRGIILPDGADLVYNSSDSTYSLFRNGQEFVRGICFDANDQLTPASTQLLQDAGVDTFDHANAVSHVIDQTRTSKDFVNDHPELFEKIKRVLWYDNDTPQPTFDKGELRLWWGGKGNTGLDVNGNFVFDVSQMQPDGSYHSGLSADAMRLAADGKLKILLSLSKDTQSMTAEVPIDANGNAVIDPNSEIGKIFFKVADGKAKFLGRFAEVAENIGDKEGVEQVRILATHESAGLKDLVDKVTVTEKNPDSLWEIPCEEEVIPPPPPVPGYDLPDAPWFIPIRGRTPLEPTQNKRFSEPTQIYYYGHGEFGLIPRDKYRERMSKQITENPELDLSGDDSALIHEYLDKQNPEYLKELEDIVEGTPKMDRNTEVVITVPIYNEGKILEKTLRNFAKMKDRQRFEIVFLENHPRGVERDNTAEVIKGMQREFPDMKIVHLYKQFDSKPPIGQVRKYLVDAVLFRKQQADLKQSVAIVSNDGDLDDISENYANAIADAFKENKKIDALAAKWDFPEETFKKFPLLHGAQRLWHFYDIWARKNYLKSPNLIGRNSAFRSGAYAAIGGYNESAQLAEDLEIGWLIKNARNYDAERIEYLNKAWLVSSPRRAVVKMLSDSRLVHQYGDFHINEEVRRATLEELLAVKRDFKPDEFQKEIQAIYDFYGRWRKSKNGWIEDSNFEKTFQRAMDYLGVNFKVVDDHVEITEDSRLQQRLAEYENRKEKEKQGLKWKKPARKTPAEPAPKTPKVEEVKKEKPKKKEVDESLKEIREAKVYFADQQGREKNLEQAFLPFERDNQKILEQYRNKDILLKVNLVDPDNPQSCTAIETIKKVVELISKYGPRKIYVGDIPSEMGKRDRSWDELKAIYEAKLRYRFGGNVELINLESLPETDIKGEGVKFRVKDTGRFGGVINLSRPKMHGTFGFTGSAKNLMGFLTQKSRNDMIHLHGERRRGHPVDVKKEHDRLHAFISAMLAQRPDMIHIMDGNDFVVGHEHIGTPVKTDFATVSRDPYNADHSAVKLLGLKKDAINYLNGTDFPEDDKKLAGEIHRTNLYPSPLERKSLLYEASGGGGFNAVDVINDPRFLDRRDVKKRATSTLCTTLYDYFRGKAMDREGALNAIKSLTSRKTFQEVYNTIISDLELQRRNAYQNMPEFQELVNEWFKEQTSSHHLGA